METSDLLKRNVEYLLSQRHMSQSALARAIGMHQPTLSRNINRVHKGNMDNIRKVAEYFGVSVDDLLDKPLWMAKALHSHTKDTTNVKQRSVLKSEVQNIVTLYRNKIKAVPLISVADAVAWMDKMDRSVVKVLDDIYVGPNVSKYAFGFRQKDESMMDPSGLQSIPPGAIVIVDPMVKEKPGKLVLASIGSSIPTVKKYVVDAGRRQLRPLHPQFRMIDIDANCKILGVVVDIRITPP